MAGNNIQGHTKRNQYVSKIISVFQISAFLSMAIIGAVLAAVQVIVAATGAHKVHDEYDYYFGKDSAVSGHTLIL